MSDPKLRVRSSGHGGSGYRHPLTGDVVPGVTTVLKMMHKPQLMQWAVDQTAAFAVANVESLLSRSEDVGWGFLRWYWNRDPLKDEVDIRNYYNGVRDDAASLGTLIHEWIEAEHGGMYPDTTDAPEFFWQMVNAWNIWQLSHTVKAVESEVTLWSHQYGYAGTADGIWEVDGVRYLIDVKSSRHIWDEHYMQLAALGAADVMMVENPDGSWREEPVPPFSGYAVLHIRPQDNDNDGNIIEPYCRLEVLSVEEMPEHFEAFRGLLATSHSQNKIKEIRKNAQSKTGF